MKPYTTSPVSIQRAAAAVGVVTAIHLVALVLIQLHSQEITTALHNLHPEAAGETFQQLYTQAVTAPSIVHIVLPIILLLAIWSVLKKHTRFSRIRLSVLLGIQILAHATIPLTIATLPQEAVSVIAVQSLSFVFELAALYLLWVPQESKNFFSSSAPKKS